MRQPRVGYGDARRFFRRFAASGPPPLRSELSAGDKPPGECVPPAPDDGGSVGRVVEDGIGVDTFAPSNGAGWPGYTMGQTATMSKNLNRHYMTGPAALLTMPLDVNDNPASVKFQNLALQKVKLDGNTEEGVLADPHALFGTEKDPRKNVQIMYGIKQHRKLPGGEIVDRNPSLPPNVVLADINPLGSGGYKIRGFNGAGGRADGHAVGDVATVSFEAYGGAAESWIRTGTGAAFHAYYLPWKKNHSRVLKLGGDADFFFTSALTGCTVQVFGSYLSPTVTHTNAGGIKDETESQAYMTELLKLYQNTGGSWTPFKENVNEVTRKDYKAIAEKNLDRKVAREKDVGDIELVGAPTTKTIVVGFRDGNAGWSFYYQTWVKIHYRKARQVGRGFSMEEKKMIRIKKVAQFWPAQQVLGNAWKDVDLN